MSVFVLLKYLIRSKKCSVIESVKINYSCNILVLFDAQLN